MRSLDQIFNLRRVIPFAKCGTWVLMKARFGSAKPADVVKW
jgi:hypothetical protein